MIFAPQPLLQDFWQGLEIFWVVMTRGGGLPLGHSTAEHAQDNRPNKDNLVHNVNRAETEKHVICYESI